MFRFKILNDLFKLLRAPFVIITWPIRGVHNFFITCILFGACTLFYKLHENDKKLEAAKEYTLAELVGYENLIYNSKGVVIGSFNDNIVMTPINEKFTFFKESPGGINEIFLYSANSMVSYQYWYPCACNGQKPKRHLVPITRDPHIFILTDKRDIEKKYVCYNYNSHCYSMTGMKQRKHVRN